MWLDELVALAEELRSRATEQRKWLRGKETRTRYALIDPMLSALGWDVHDPARAIPEYTDGQLGRGRLDYALLGSGPRPIVLVEAKGLGIPLDEGVKQARDYCDQTGIRHFAVTDGNAWRIYDLRLDGPLDKRVVVEFLLDEQDLSPAMNKLWEWRAKLMVGLRAGVVQEAAKAPNDFRSATRPVVAQSRSVPSTPLTEPSVATPPTSKASVPSGWVPLITLYEKVRGKKGLTGWNKPKAVRLPGGEERDSRSWIDVRRHIVNWSAERGFLTPDKCPLVGPNGGVWVDTIPVGGDGVPFETPQQVPGKHLYWEGKFRAPIQIELSVNLLRKLGLDTGGFSVRFD